jgi:DNA-binding MarR family transcriptional regulator
MHRSDEVLVALRRVIRAIDIHSKKLAQQHGLTGPQALIIKEVIRQQSVSIGLLAKEISLSHATVTDIVKRLESRGLLLRQRSEQDRRQVFISATPAAKERMKHSIPLLQEKFIERFEKLAQWEQTQIVSSLEHISAMMDAEEIEASPILHIKAPTANPEPL